MDRRSFLIATGAATTPALAGCSFLSNDADENTPTPTPTPTPEPEHRQTIHVDNRADEERVVTVEFLSDEGDDPIEGGEVEGTVEANGEMTLEASVTPGDYTLRLWPHDRYYMMHVGWTVEDYEESARLTLHEDAEAEWEVE